MIKAMENYIKNILSINFLKISLFMVLAMANNPTYGKGKDAFDPFNSASFKKPYKSDTVKLIKAALEDRSDTIKYLIKNGANINAQLHVIEQYTDPGLEGKAGYTALMAASERGYDHIVELLISNGADVNIVSYNHKTAASLAFKNIHNKVEIKYIRCMQQIIRKGGRFCINNMSELKKIIDVSSSLNSRPIIRERDTSLRTWFTERKNYLVLGDEFPLGSELERAIIFGDMKTVKELAPSDIGYWGSCTPSKGNALALAVLTNENEIFNYLCDTWNVSLTKNTLETILDWLCFLEPTNLSLYLNDDKQYIITLEPTKLSVYLNGHKQYSIKKEKINFNTYKK